MLRQCIVTDGVRVPGDTSWIGVTLRCADGDSSPGETLIDGLAIGPISPSNRTSPSEPCLRYMVRMVHDMRLPIACNLTASMRATASRRFSTRSGPGSREAKVVPLTGDASDRRYFRVLFRDAPPQVLAVHPGPIDFDALPFVNVARLLSAMPVPVPADPGPFARARDHRARGSRRRHAAGACRRGVAPLSMRRSTARPSR